MVNDDDASIDEILKSIRMAIIENEHNKYLNSLAKAEANKKKAESEEDVFVLSKNMMVKREDIPYQLGVWNFDDVAKKMLKKYRNYFNSRRAEIARNYRVMVKEDKIA